MRMLARCIKFILLPASVLVHGYSLIQYYNSIFATQTNIYLAGKLFCCCEVVKIFNPIIYIRERTSIFPIASYII